MLRKHWTDDLLRECIRVQPIAMPVKVRVQNQELALSWEKVLSWDPSNWTAESVEFIVSPVLQGRAEHDLTVCVPKSRAALAGEIGTARNSQHCSHNTSIKNEVLCNSAQTGFLIQSSLGKQKHRRAVFHDPT